MSKSDSFISGDSGAVNVTALPQQHRWRRISAHPRFMHYNRLILLVLAVDVLIFYYGFASNKWWDPQAGAIGALSNMVIFNIGLAILIRQQLIINMLFRLAASAPTSWPLSVRRVLGKIYHFGGLHVGGTVAGTLWFLILLASLTSAYRHGTAQVSIGSLVVSYLIAALLMLIIVFAYPAVRSRYHNWFEWSHRFGGWTALALLWGQTVLLTIDQRGTSDLGRTLLTAPGVWMLLIVTVSVALPWLQLRRVPLQIERPSSHVALVHFGKGMTPMLSSSTVVSRHPLLEWHTFANAPALGSAGSRLVISRAGDWTGRLIDELPTHLWVKGRPTAGVGYIDRLFKRVVWVATGSGIGPALPQLLAQRVPARLIWATKEPRKTYGDALVDEILSVQPDALIWDTDERGRPDLLSLAYDACVRFNAEAVICISNKKLTWDVVYGLESRGIPAYGAIWDS